MALFIHFYLQMMLQLIWYLCLCESVSIQLSHLFTYNIKKYTKSVFRKTKLDFHLKTAKFFRYVCEYVLCDMYIYM